MFLKQFLPFIIAAPLLSSCASDKEWITDDSNPLYKIEVPEHMVVTKQLNPEASTQYQYIDVEGEDTLENYLVVITETKQSIEKLNIGFEFDALTYAELSLLALKSGLDHSEVVSGEPEIETVNGLDCVKIEVEGSLNQLGIYYMVAIFEGEHAFYQILTWTLLEQRDHFQKDMEGMINSFEEK